MIRELIETASLEQILGVFIALGILIAIILCLVFIIWGGIRFIIAAGDEEAIKKATNTVRFAFIGMFVAFFAYFIIYFIARMFDVPYEIEFSTIVDLMNEIFESLQ